MKVLLVGNYVHDRQESMLRFSSILELGLRQAGHQVQVCRPVPIAGRLCGSDAGTGKWLGYLDKFAAFPTMLRSAARQADIVHICDHSNSFYVRHVRNGPHIVTCHDMLGIRAAFNETPLKRPGWTGRHLQRLILNGLTEARHVACVSQATYSDVLRMARLPASRVSKVYNGLNYPYSPMPQAGAEDRLRRLGLHSGARFILHVGGNSWYKNRMGVLKIFAALRGLCGPSGPKLVMAGKPWMPEMRQFVNGAGLGSEVFEIRDVGNEDLRALYTLARLMLFPSLEEGFGWPIVEAQACGCVVVTSDRCPMNEVGGNAAVYVNPDDIEGAAITVKELLERRSGSPSLHEPSIANAKRFTTARMIREYVGLYERVLDEAA
jgi:glycosyltransferase involved in cell wall biosynthesis